MFNQKAPEAGQRPDHTAGTAGTAGTGLSLLLVPFLFSGFAFHPFVSPLTSAGGNELLTKELMIGF